MGWNSIIKAGIYSVLLKKPLKSIVKTMDLFSLISSHKRILIALNCAKTVDFCWWLGRR
jgi:hypothetical protein